MTVGPAKTDNLIINRTTHFLKSWQMKYCFSTCFCSRPCPPFHHLQMNKIPWSYQQNVIVGCAFQILSFKTTPTILRGREGAFCETLLVRIPHLVSLITKTITTSMKIQISITMIMERRVRLCETLLVKIPHQFSYFLPSWRFLWKRFLLTRNEIPFFVEPGTYGPNYV